MKNKYKLLLVFSICLFYGSLNYFSNAGFPIKALLTILFTLIFLKDEESLTDSLCLMIPSLIIGYVLSITFKDVNSEWFLFAGFIVYFFIIYVYSYILKILKRS